MAKKPIKNKETSINEVQIIAGEELTEADIKKRLRPIQVHMVEALYKTMGIVSKACEAVGISRDTHYEWLKKHKEYKMLVDSINERAVDYAESQLFNLINGATRQMITNTGQVVDVKEPPNTTAVIFYLKTKGKNRGYIEKSEIDLGLPQDVSQMVFAVKRREE